MTDPLEPQELYRLLDEAAKGSTGATFDAVHAKAHRSRRTRMIGAVAGVVAIAAAAITIPVALVQHSNPSTPGPVHHVNLPAQVIHENPLKLVNRWTVHGPGIRDTSLVLGQELAVIQPCGALDGNWRADDFGDFLGSVEFGPRSCFQGANPTDIPWLDLARAFRIDGSSASILGVGGDVLATLTPAERPIDAPADWRPRVRPSIRAKFAAPGALPAGLTPASTASAVGAWRPIESPLMKAGAVLVLGADRYALSDGCSGWQANGYLVGPDGLFLHLPSEGEFVSCYRLSSADLRLAQSRRLGMDRDGHLVMVARNGSVLSRLQRLPTGTVSGVVEEDGGPAPGLRARPGVIYAHPVGSTSYVVAEANVDAKGRFKILLPVGQYVLVGDMWLANNHQCARSPEISVTAGAVLHTQALCQVE
jgi:hypothetical protein